MDLSIILVVVFGLANILDRHFIAKRANEAAAAAADERLHLIHMIAAKNAGEVIVMDRAAAGTPKPKDPEVPGFRHNPIS